MIFKTFSMYTQVNVGLRENNDAQGLLLMNAMPRN